MRLFAIVFFAATLTVCAEESSFTSFTGKILKDKVRMRLEPSLDSPIIREFNKEDILVVVGEKEDFYAVKPPADFKAFIYRTYVLDGLVEGSHVNVRLAPDTDSSVITQLNSGDSVTGKISDTSNRWMEILPPDSVQFFIAKDYITKAKAPTPVETVDFSQQKTEIKQLLDASTIMGHIEIEKPFDQIVLNDINANLETIINEYNEFPEEVSLAKQVQQNLNEKYLAKKSLYEEETNVEQIALAELDLGKNSSEPEASKETTNVAKAPIEPIKATVMGIEHAKAEWLTAENSFFTVWAEENQNTSTHDFYSQEREKATILSGVIAPYNRPVRNKPGDFVLLGKINRLPVAFLYSTILNLDTYEEQEVTIKAVERPNNNFAFPAYYVLSIE